MMSFVMEQDPDYGCMKEAFVQTHAGRVRDEALEQIISQTDRDRD